MGVKRDHDTMEGTSETKFTDDEAALYDRQIRLWGINCQNRIRETSILMIGLNGLGLEIAKNLTLSGVKSITIMDETPVSELDSSAQYYVVGCTPGSTRAEASKASIQELNPNVSVKIDKEPLEAKGAAFFEQFTVVFATGLPVNQLIKINSICHQKNIPFYSGDTWGLYGYAFADLQEFECTKLVKKQSKETAHQKEVPHNIKYPTLESVLKLKIPDIPKDRKLGKDRHKVFILFHMMNHFYNKHKRFPSPLTREADYDDLKNSRDACAQELIFDSVKENISDSFLENVFGEMSPVCAVVGGIIANDIIKAISKQYTSISNFFLFDGEVCIGICPKYEPSADEPVVAAES